jgi:hypothetical protein
VADLARTFKKPAFLGPNRETKPRSSMKRLDEWDEYRSRVPWTQAMLVGVLKRLRTVDVLMRTVDDHDVGVPGTQVISTDL